MEGLDTPVSLCPFVVDNISSLRIPDPLDSSKVIRQAANFFQLAPKTKRLEAILDRVPTAIDMELLASTNSKILKATRLESSRGGRGRQETTSVKILWEGATLPKYLTIGILGRFPTRRYVPDPRQCYRCLRFGHIARACVAVAALRPLRRAPREQGEAAGEGDYAGASVRQLRGESCGFQQLVPEAPDCRLDPVRDDPGPASSNTPSTEEDRQGVSIDGGSSTRKYPRSQPGPVGWFADRHEVREGWRQGDEVGRPRGVDFRLRTSPRWPRRQRARPRHPRPRRRGQPHARPRRRAARPKPPRVAAKARGRERSHQSSRWSLPRRNQPRRAKGMASQERPRVNPRRAGP